MKNILILRPNLGVKLNFGEKLHDFEIICPAMGLRTLLKGLILFYKSFMYKFLRINNTIRSSVCAIINYIISKFNVQMMQI